VIADQDPWTNFVFFLNKFFGGVFIEILITIGTVLRIGSGCRWSTLPGLEPLNSRRSDEELVDQACSRHLLLQQSFGHHLVGGLSAATGNHRLQVWRSFHP
jgi:hypothetical protein